MVDAEKRLIDMFTQDKYSREQTLKALPDIYQDQIVKLLFDMEKIELNQYQADKKRDILDNLLESLKFDNKETSYIKKEIFDCLGDIEKSIENKEIFYYKRKILVDNFFNRFKFFLTYKNLFLIPFIRKNIGTNSRYLVDAVSKLSFDEIKNLSEFGEYDTEISHNIENIVQDTLKKIIETQLVDYTTQIDQYIKDDIIQNAKEKFSNVWNNKLMFFDRPNQVKELDRKFQEYLFVLLREYFLDYISYNSNKYKSVSALFHDFFISLNFILLDWSIDNIFKDFAQNYVDAIFEKTHESKVIKPNGEIDQTLNIEKINSVIHSHVPKKSINIELLNLISELSDKLEISDSQKNEFKRLFLKRYNKKIQIRISDLQERFSISPDKITSDIIQKLKKIWFNIMQDHIPKEIISSPSNESVNIIKEDTDNQPPDTDNQELSNELREEKNLIKIFEAYSYIISNPKKLEKQFDLLYPTDKKKEWVFSILRTKIQKPEKRNILQYRAIDLRYWHRILILNRNEIDWIYNHEEYSKRVKAII